MTPLTPCTHGWRIRAYTDVKSVYTRIVISFFRNRFVVILTKQILFVYF
jgi:hypothetical protein